MNNLGEGLYGWMKKFERDSRDGFLTLTGSAGRIMFVTCFVHGLCGADSEYLACLESNSDCAFYLNGVRVSDSRVILKNGINWVFLLVRAGGRRMCGCAWYSKIQMAGLPQTCCIGLQWMR